MAEILNAHGSRNDIFVVPLTPRDFASDDELTAFVQRLCDRAGPFGGDGVYFYDGAPPVPEAWSFNPAGSSAAAPPRKASGRSASSTPPSASRRTNPWSRTATR